MKRLSILSIISLLAVAACAQHVRYGLQVGYDQRIIRQHFVSGGAVHTKNLYGIHVGPTFDISIDKVEGLGIKTGVFYQITAKKMGDDLLWEADNLNAHLVSQLVQVPVWASYTYEVNKYWDVFVYAGPQLEVGIQQSDMGSYTEGGQKYSFGGNEYTGSCWVRQGKGEKVTRVTPDQGYDYKYRQKRCDLDLGFGVGFRYSHLTASLGFDWGVINRAAKSSNPKNNKIHTGIMQFSVGYLF